MATGLTSMSKLAEIGPAYPFHGMEGIFTLVVVAFFVYFFIRQVVMEDLHHQGIIGNFTASPTE